MRTRSGRPVGRPRRGLAIAELTIVLGTLTFICLAACDFARVFYNSVAITNCARDGAMYGSSAKLAGQTTYTCIAQAALADATNLNPQPTVTSANGTDAANGISYIDVTVSQTFQTLVTYPGIPSTIKLSRKVRMPIVP